MAAESLRQVVELFPGPALVVGPGGEVLGANDRAERWIGPGRGELRGPAAGRGRLRPARAGGRVPGGVHAGRPEGGGDPHADAGRRGRGECRVEGISVPARPGRGRADAGGHPCRPRRDRRRGSGRRGREETLEALREEVRRKDEFLDRLAHDLRNPVAAISGALHLARRATAPEDVAWAEEAMERQLKHLVRQLDDLLDLSRLAAGRSG